MVSAPCAAPILVVLLTYLAGSGSSFYFVGAQDAVLDLLQGEVTEAQIQPILSTLAR